MCPSTSAPKPWERRHVFDEAMFHWNGFQSVVWVLFFLVEENDSLFHEKNFFCQYLNKQRKDSIPTATITWRQSRSVTDIKVIVDTF